MRSNCSTNGGIFSEPLFMRSWRSRSLIDSDGEKSNLMIRRLMCSGCDRTHHELPDCVVPYKRHCAETIEAIINGKPEKTPCEERTIRRILTWWSVMLPYLLNILKSLACKYKISCHASPAFKEMVRAAVNSNGWTFANLICTCSVCVSG